MSNLRENFQPLTQGDTYFTFISEIFRIKSRQYVTVKCQCGAVKNVRLDSILNGVVKSCGCYKSEREKHKTLTRGGVYYQIYELWRAIKSRCYKPTNISYKWYGAKGITMCDEWKNSCDEFNRWATNNGYKRGLQIDRIDSNKGYSPENCRFVTPKENIRNKNTTILITHNGESRPLSEWADIYNIPRSTLWGRYKSGCDKSLLFSKTKIRY